VIGCSIAWRLAQSGLKVTLFERGRVGCEASRAAAGMLSPQGETQQPGPFFELCLRSRSMYRAFAEELKEASGIDVEYKDEGTLFVVLEGEDENEKIKWAAWQLEAGLRLEHVSANQIRNIEHAVTKTAPRAIFLPDEHQVENRLVMDALEVAIKRAGVELIEGAEVNALTTERGNVNGVISEGQRVDASAVVVAAGSWSSELLAPLGMRVKVTPARGQMVALRGETCPITRVIHSSKVYLVPRRDGRVLIGATVEYAGFVKAVTAEGITRLLTAAIEVVPQLKDFAIVESWSGLRPDTIDHLPIIGPGNVKNLWLATGHFRNGILLAPATAGAIASSIESGYVSDGFKPFGIGRLEARLPVDSF